MENDIVFDASSGISIDEQKEILAGINGITEKNRLSLSGQEKAGKRGVLFPLVVNIALFLLLAGGFLLILFLQGKQDLAIRLGRAAYNPAERILIQELRRETALRLQEKEHEISLVVSKLTDVDAELQELQMSAGLEAEERRETLRRLQEDYRSSLDTLQNDRTEILETARARETALHAQLEERAKELAAVSERSEAALNSAQAELGRLSALEERMSAIDGQIAGYYASVNEYMRNGEYGGAEEVLRSMKDFLNTPAFQGISAFNARKGLYAASAAALEAGVNAAQRTGPVSEPVSVSDAAGDTDIAELRAENARLAENAAELERTIAAFNSQGSDLARRISEYEESIQTLRTQASAQEGIIAARDTAIAELQSGNAELNGTLALRDAAITQLRAQGAEQAAAIESLNNQLTSIRQALQALTQ
jgi:chromosome segregation ATPase